MLTAVTVLLAAVIVLSVFTVAALLDRISLYRQAIVEAAEQAADWLSMTIPERQDADPFGTYDHWSGWRDAVLFITDRVGDT
jgi:hypothetical protein